MRALSAPHLVVGLVMVAAFGLSFAFKPGGDSTHRPPSVNLEQMVPGTFGDWKVDPRMLPVPPSPEVKESLDRVYSEILGRTYFNAKGQHIMLSIAYSGRIDHQMDVHRPEVCYPAQGFDIRGLTGGTVSTQLGNIPVRRLVGRLGKRVEPITYWITAGDRAVTSGFQRKFSKLLYSISGQVADGMLIRVSSLDQDEGRAYQVQDEFINSMVSALADKDRARIVGAL